VSITASESAWCWYPTIRYVFQHPGREDVRIVLVDALTGFRDRVDANEEVAELLSHVVATFEFFE
jgi:hypothetical protein